MKKILIAILLLIPLVVLLSINVSGMIISAEIAINIESMSLTHKGDVVESTQILLEEYTKTNKKYQLFVDYYPSIAQNKSILWATSDRNIATVDDGIVTFVDYGSVTVTATAASNTSCSASCIFYIVGEEISTVNLELYGENEPIDALILKKYQVQQLKADVIPATALGENKIEWSSDAESVVTVDDNGVLTAISQGTARITAKARGTKGVDVSETIEVSVEGEMLSVADTIYISEASCDLSALLTQENVSVYINNLLVLNKTVELDIGESVVAELRHNGESEFVSLFRKATNKALVFENISALDKGIFASGNYIPKGGADVVLKAVAAEGELPDGASIIWSSNNTNVLRVVGGRLYGEAPGTAVVTASLNGYESAEIEISVATPISYITLEYDAAEDKAGLAEQRVFGVYSVKNRVCTNQIKLNFKSTYPNVLDTADYENLFDFSSSDTSLATVDDFGVISFSRDAIGQTVTITAEARYSPLFAKDSYTFKLVDGINVGIGYGTNKYDEENGIMPNFEPFHDAMYLANEYRGDLDEFGTVAAIVLHTNIYYPENPSGDYQMCFSRNIYGNGFKLDGQLHSKTFTSRMFGSTTNGLFNPQRPLDIIIENVSIQSYAPISEDSVEAFRELANYGGMPWYKSASNASLEGITHIFRYCLFQYAYSQMELSGGKTVLDGCIFRNTAGPAIVMQTGKDNASELVIKNCIFSNSVAPSVLTTCGEFLSDSDTRDGTKYFTIKMEGESYIYNWKKLDDSFRMDIIPTTNLAYSDKLPLYEAINNNLAEWIKIALKDERNLPLVYKNLKGEYVNLGIMMLPLWVPNFAELNPEPEHFYNEGISVVGDAEKIKMDPLIVETSLTTNPVVKAAMKMFGIRIADCPLNLVVTKGDKNGYNTMPDEQYELNEVTVARLHGRYADDN